MDRRQLNFTVTAASFSPLFYGLIAYLIKDYSMSGVELLRTLYRAFLVVSFFLILVSRPVENIMAPRTVPAEKLPPGRPALASMVLSGMAECISILGLLCIYLGKGIEAYAPFFIMSALAYVDFRIFRFPRLLELVRENGPPGGGD